MNINNTNGFTRNNCYIASLFASAIYPPKDWKKKGLDPNGPIKHLAQKFGMSFIPYEVENHRAGICKRHDFAIISYCGTNDLKDFFDDLKYFQDQIPGTPVMVHRGVNKGYMELQRKMSTELRKIFISNRKWIVTGHSLGGGLAVRSLIENKNPNGHCYTYGAMRVGNSEMFDNIYVPITRVVRGKDVITDLPKEHMVISGCKYKHLQDKLIYLNHDGSITIGGRTLWGNIKEHLAGIAGDVGDLDLIPYNIEAHFIDGYCEDLAQWEGQ